MTIRRLAIFKVFSVACISLLITMACSAEEDPSVNAGQTDSANDSTAIDTIDAASDLGEPGQSTSQQDALSSLDDLLPHEFAALTDAWQGDLDGMVDRRVLRVLVVSGGPMFFYHRGKPRGIVAEMLVRMQKQINENLGRRLDQLEIIPMPVSRERLIPALVSGQADLIAADLTITPERAELADFSIPLAREIDEVVVFATGRGEDVKSLDDLAGQSIYVQESSSYYEHLVALNESFVRRALEPIEIVKANGLLRTQDILEMLNAGLVSATVVDEYKASLWSQIFTNLSVREDLVIHANGEIAWLFRKNSPQLEAAVNDFMRGHRAGTLVGNVLINRYMDNLKWVRSATSQASEDRLRPLLELFRAGAKENNLDTLMLVAQAYQESNLDNDRKSPAGAVGIMQIKPSTAADKNVGIKDISTPADNIRAGARYMRFLMDRYFSDPDMDELHQWLFGLAAYNAGPARVRRMRDQAAAEGHDPNLWIDNVELVAARQIGRETIHYVRNVYKYYIAYRMSWEERLLKDSIDTIANVPSPNSIPPVPAP